MTTSNSTSLHQQTKQVSFCEADNTTHYDATPMTMEQRKSLSYNAQELGGQKESDLLDVMMVRTMGKHARNWDTRGLESQLEDNSGKASERKEYARDIIHLYRETLMEGSGISQDTLLAFARKMSKPDCKDALKRGKKDQTEASKVYKEAKMGFRRTQSKEKLYFVSLPQGISLPVQRTATGNVAA